MAVCVVAWRAKLLAKADTGAWTLQGQYGVVALHL